MPSECGILGAATAWPFSSKVAGGRARFDALIIESIVNSITIEGTKKVCPDLLAVVMVTGDS